jgi:hypothetical protein
VVSGSGDPVVTGMIQFSQYICTYSLEFWQGSQGLGACAQIQFTLEAVPCRPG